MRTILQGQRHYSHALFPLGGMALFDKQNLEISQSKEEECRCFWWPMSLPLCAQQQSNEVASPYQTDFQIDILTIQKLSKS